jgi:hypothetical protein
MTMCEVAFGASPHLPSPPHRLYSTSHMSLAMAYIHASTVHQPSEYRKFSVFSETSFVFSTKHRCNVMEFPLDPHTSHGGRRINNMLSGVLQYARG